MMNKKMTDKPVAVLNGIVSTLPLLVEFHAPDNPVHILLKGVAHEYVSRLYAAKKTTKIDLGDIGSIRLPYVQMGATSTINLFDMDELIMFAFYSVNRQRYRNVADMGANIGMHAVVLGACGYSVRSYEPDPEHVKTIQRVIRLNSAKKVRVINAAISDEKGEAEFVKVLGNTTSSHLAGAKSKPYGRLERFMVPTQPIGPVLRWADLIKMDIEGHEAQALEATTKADWQGTDGLVEIGSPVNARRVYRHLEKQGLNLFAQKNGWQRVKKLADMPQSYRDGTLFITYRDQMPWG